MPRVAVVTSHPIQYQAPWFQALARELDLTVFFAHRQDAKGQAAAGFGHEFEWDVPLLDGYAFEWLRNVSSTPGVEGFAGCDTPDIGQRLEAGAFDACIVNGWYLKTYLQTITACRTLGIPVLMRGDSHLRTPRSPIVSIAKHLPYRWMLGRVAAHLYVGRANRAYLEHYGVRSQRLFFAPHFVDNARFAASAARARANGAAEMLRAQAGADRESRVFVFAGKLIEKKRPADFIDALAALRRAGLRARGLVVGSGPLGAALESRAAAADAAVTWLGFRNQSEMPECYAAADCLVLPSDGRETWGLVANEAMACGVPIIVSDAVGCGDDLAAGGAGEIYPMGNVQALADGMTHMITRLASGSPDVHSAVADRIARYSCEAAVTGTLEALNSVLNARPARRGVTPGHARTPLQGTPAGGER
jgi:glycosyltransferase involved in cell wall biosynthesis